MNFINIKFFVYMPICFVFLAFVVKQSDGEQSMGQLYDRIENQEMTGSEYTSLNVRFYGDCALECNNDSACRAFVMYPKVSDTITCGLFSCAQNTTQSQGVTSYVKLKPKDCDDIRQSSSSPSGLYELTKISDWGVCTSYMAYCDMEAGNDGAGWTVLMRRQNGNTNFIRNWSEYKDGFGDLNDEFWIGNEPMHQITNNNGKAYVLRVDMVTADNVTLFAEYSTFGVGGEGTNYTLTVAGHAGTAEDLLTLHSGEEFSTRDQDHDDHPTTHCSEYYRGGWWFYDCFRVLLTGPYGQLSGDNIPGVTWKDNVQWLDLTYAVMKIKPV